jgi:CCR4-NOT transcriptional complex subunit CAF120
MTQWTAAIRLSMYEHTSLYEAYTGSLIAARGKNLPGIQSILMPTKFKHEDWARVRFGAGTPWRRCWFVINPPNEKEIQKARKAMKKSAYDRLSIPVLGNIQFFETKKTKKVQPIATVTNVYSAYAIYPQSKALIDQSTLVKLEGRIHMHKQPQSSAEGLVFVMPELHAAVSGFETMLRFLFPTFDAFNLYGRPTRLVADTNHIKSIMFAFPKQRRYGYLDVLDITNLLQIPGSQEWSEAEWRKQLKEATQKRISTGRSGADSVNSSRPRYRSSISMRNSDTPINPLRQPFSPPGSKPEFNQSAEAVIHEIPKTEPPIYHSRGMSDITGMQTGPRPGHGSVNESSPHSSAQDLVQRDRAHGAVAPIAERTSSESDRPPAGFAPPGLNGEQFPPRTPPSPVASPPSFVHGPRSMPANRPEASSEQRLANNRMSHATLSQLTSVGKMGMAGSAVAFRDQPSDSRIDQRSQGHPPGDRFSLAQAAYMNPTLPHSSSDEGIGIVLPLRAPQTTEQRPTTPSSGGTPSPQQLLNVDVPKSVKRKPLPQRPLFGQEPFSPDGEPSFDDLRHTLDEDALNRIAPHLPSPVSPYRNEEESVYDDASTVSPDYASTHESVHSKKSQKSVTRPRMGTMKTVGMPAKQDLVIGDAHYSTEMPPEVNPDIPAVDFGPTLTYMPTTGRPSTGDTLRKASNQRNDLDAAERYRPSVPTSQMDRGHQRTPSQEEYRRSVLWQPGMTTNRPVTPAGGLSPEQYVQQRAAPSPPMHMHHRSPSNNTPPPQARPVSGDWANHVRSSSRMTTHQDPNYRPSSRGTGTMLNNYNDVSNHLSAREQEHVARVTGSSFFNLNQANRGPQPQLQGRSLVSTIDAREREKREMREGMSNQMVQHAIAHRQQVMNQQPYAPQYAGSMYPPQQAPQQASQQPMYNLPGASHTWDALHQMGRPDEPRRSSWYGQLPQAAGQAPPSYQPSQHYAQPGEYPNNYHAMRY